MPYEATCPKGHRFQVVETNFGQRLSCPTCGEAFVVPDLSGRSQPSGAAGRPTVKIGMDPRRWINPDFVSGLSRSPLLKGRPLVAVGLVLVLLARGCDTLGKRATDRAAAKATVARDQFNDEWQKARLDLEAKIATIEEKSEPKAEDQKMLTDLKTQLAELPGRQAKAQRNSEAGTWRALDIKTRSTKANDQINGYWREMFFVFASMILAVGLLMVSWTADGAERWVSLIMLAIITVSIFIGGAAWIPMGR
jgi:hypothetical protein